MMKTIHSFTQQPQTSLWLAGYRSAKVEINDTQGLSGEVKV
jgi:ribosome modulation factor